MCVCEQVEFPPDLCSRVTFVNFTVTRSSLQSQCLNEVLKAERPDVDEKRSDLLKLQGAALGLRGMEQRGLAAVDQGQHRAEAPVVSPTRLRCWCEGSACLAL